MGVTLATVAIALPASAAASGGNTSYSSSGSPAVDGVLNGPWNTSQGDGTAGTPYQSADLFPTYTPGGDTTTLGGVTEPNLAVYPGASSPPYPSGVAGTPGPLDGYCTSGGANPESGSEWNQPANSDLPMAPYYFPDIVRNSDGSLTGYFDWRPKDADEAITVAKSTDNGQTWSTEGEALEQNPGYCPTADTNDDGQGHPFVATIGSTSNLYTLQRQAGDNPGIGLLVNGVNPSATNPLSAVPASQPVGIDPNTFVTASTTVPSAGGVPIRVSTLGSAGSPEQIVNGSYEDVPAGNSEPSSSTIINCTGPTSAPSVPGPGSLTGCTSATVGSVSLSPGDDLIQVIATGNPTSTTGSRDCATIGSQVPSGPNNPSGTGGLSALCYSQPSTPVAPITDSLWGSLAPNRVYINGQTVYCNGVSSGLVKLENCTTSGSPFSYQTGEPITGDPITPPGATMTTGLVAPDGIVGTLPSYPGVPATIGGAPTSTVLYTEKILNYYIEGVTNGKITNSGTYSSSTVTLPLSSSQELNYQPSVTSTEPLPSSGAFTVYVGVTDSSGNFIQALNCMGWAAATQSGAPAGSIDLSGCTGGTSAETIVSGTDVGGPNAAIAPYAALGKIGEGKNGATSGPTTLFGNNEDYTALRAAYTTDGMNFTDVGPISGAGSESGENSGNYNDISNPNQQESPASATMNSTSDCSSTCTTPENLPIGSTDEIEMRYVGSRGAIVTNPDGSYGMFLSGAWSSDGDSDAFNQIFYSSSTDGQTWSVPKVVTSTDYTFSASAAQSGTSNPLGVSAYYSGRAYGPSVVQNPNGSLTMVFAGYRLPKPITSAATALGTGSTQYTVGATDPALYRNILTQTLSSSTSPAVGTSVAVSSSNSNAPSNTPVTYTATVSLSGTGSGTPTGTVAFTDNGNPISGCAGEALSDSSPDIATCTTTPPAGSSTIQATYSGDSNYATSNGSTTQQADYGQTISFTSTAPSNAAYGGSYAVSATGGGSGNPVTFSIDGSSTSGACSISGSNVSFIGTGDCIVDANQAGGGNGGNTYDAAPQISQSFFISPATIHIDANPASITYGQADPTPSGTLRATDFQNGDSSSVVSGSPSCSIASHSENAGTYSGAITCTTGTLSATNYMFVSGNAADLTINPATIHIDASPASKTYGQSDPSPSGTLRSAELQNGDSASSFTGSPSCSISSYSESAATYGGAISCTPGTLSDANYTVVEGDAADFTINPAPMHIDADPSSKTYGASDPTTSGTLRSADLQNGDTSGSITGSPSCSIASHSENAGTYSGAISCTQGTLTDSNYAFVSGNAADFTINPATLSVNADDETVSYGQTPSPGSTLTGFVNGENASSASVTGLPSCSASPSSNDPGTYPGATSCTTGTLSAPNYTFVSGQTGTLTITQASQTIGFPATGATYGQSDLNPASASSGLAVSYSNPSGKCYVGVSGLIELTGAGSCTVTATQAGNTDYQAASPVTQTFSVAKATLDVDASDASAQYGMQPALSYSLSGFVGSDTSTNSGITGQAACSANPPSKNVGSYPGAIGCSAGTLSAPNYTFATGQAGTLSTTPATLSVVAKAASAVYDTAPSLSYTLSGFVYQETASSANVSGSASCSIAAGTPSDTGRYPGAITCTPNNLSAPNYTFATGNSATLTITPAPQKLSFTSTAIPHVYGDTYTPAVSGGPSGNPVTLSIDSSSSSGACSLSSGTVTFTGVGTCAIDANQAGTQDYAAAKQAQRKVMVTPAILTTTADPESKSFGAANPTPTATITGFVGGDNGSVVSGSPSCTTTATQASPGGSYPIVCKQGTMAASNYIFHFVNGKITISYTNVITGKYGTPLTVGSGDAVRISGATIEQAVTVANGGSLDIESSYLKGGLSVSGGGTIRICNGTLESPATTTISGDSGPVLAGAAQATPACHGNKFAGSVSITGNGGGVTFDNDAVTGNLMITGNAGNIEATGNTVGGTSNVQ